MGGTTDVQGSSESTGKISQGSSKAFGFFVFLVLFLMCGIMATQALLTYSLGRTNDLLASVVDGMVYDLNQRITAMEARKIMPEADRRLDNLESFVSDFGDVMPKDVAVKVDEVLKQNEMILKGCVLKDGTNLSEGLIDDDARQSVSK